MSGPATTASILAAVAAANPAVAGMLLDDAGPRRTLLIFRGEEQLSPEAVIDGDCEVTVMTPIAGGALDDEERAVYEWQSWVRGLGWEGQERLKAASVLVSRVGGVGGAAAQQLAAAGVGRLVLAHAGVLRASDLNRQILMSHAGIGSPRVELAGRRLREINPRLDVVAVPENVTEENAGRLMGMADLAVGCAPRFGERLALNAAAVRQGKPLIDCAMWEMEGQVMAVVPGRTPCLGCLYPEEPPHWRREFPVIGAVAGVVGCLGAVEAIKMLAGLGEQADGRMLLADLRSLSFRRARVRRDPRCKTCGVVGSGLEKMKEGR